MSRRGTAPAAGAVVAAGAPRLADHPRARRSILRIKAWAGLVALVAGLVLALRADVGLDGALVRGLATGVGGYLAAWGLAVAVWTQLARGELEAHRAHLLAARDEAADGA